MRRVLARCERRRHVLAVDEGEVLGSPCIAYAARMGLSSGPRGVHSEGQLSGLLQVDDLADGGSTVAHCPQCGMTFLLEHNALRRVLATPGAEQVMAPRAL